LLTGALPVVQAGKNKKRSKNKIPVEIDLFISVVMGQNKGSSGGS